MHASSLLVFYVPLGLYSSALCSCLRGIPPHRSSGVVAGSKSFIRTGLHAVEAARYAEKHQ